MRIILGILLLVGTYVYAEPPNFDQYNYRPPPQQNIAQLRQGQQQQQQYQQRPPKESSINTIVDDVLEIILASGFPGAIIIILFGYIYRNDKNNRESQQANIDRFSDLNAECSKHMADVSAKLDSIEREMEQAQQIQLLKRS
jgi:hypothetical protein|tara:strand:- start:8 stop:433 length:426 start_codon:yes stop_codon:yes gene_type:complete